MQSRMIKVSSAPPFSFTKIMDRILNAALIGSEIKARGMGVVNTLFLDFTYVIELLVL